MRAWDRRGSDARVGRKAVEKTLSFALRSAYLFPWLCCGDDMCARPPTLGSAVTVLSVYPGKPGVVPAPGSPGGWLLIHSVGLCAGFPLLSALFSGS